jgi:hypothetical protein
MDAKEILPKFWTEKTEVRSVAVVDGEERPSYETARPSLSSFLILFPRIVCWSPFQLSATGHQCL